MQERERVQTGANGGGAPASAFTLTFKEMKVVEKLREARRLAEKGHRSRMEIMFYDAGRSCDITIEDRERVVERFVDRDMG